MESEACKNLSVPIYGLSTISSFTFLARRTAQKRDSCHCDESRALCSPFVRSTLLTSELTPW
jgi:hypothetical protein